MSRWPRGLAALAVVMPLVAVAAPSAAQGPSTRLVSQSLIVPAGGVFDLVLDSGPGAPAGTELAITVNGPLRPARRGMLAALLGAIDAPVVGLISRPLDEVPRDAAGRLDLTIPTVVRQRDKTADSIRLPVVGIYAVRVDLRTERNEVMHRFTTFLTRVDDALLAQPPSPVAVVLTADSPPTFQPDGSTTIDAAARTRAQRVGQVLTRNATTPLTVMVRPALLDGLRRSGLDADAAIAKTLAAAVGGRAVISATRERVDPAALVAAGATDDLVTQLRAGEDILVEDLGDAQPERTTWIADGALDEASLTRVRDLGARQLVVPQAALSADDTVPVDATAEMATGDDAAPLVAAAVETRLSEALVPGGDPVLSAYRLVAELSALHLDVDESARGTRGVVLMPPPSWQPDPAFLGTFLDIVATNPLLRAVELGDWFTAVRPATDDNGAPKSRTLADAATADLTAHAQAVGLTRYAVAVYGSMLTTAAATLRSEAEERLTTSMAADLLPAQRSAYVDAVNEQVDVLRSAVEPIPERRITIAGRNSEIPITLRSRVDFPVKVKVRFSSAKLTFPEGDQTVLLDGTEQLRIPVETRASGTFPLVVQILTPIGDAEVAPATQLTVQVSAFSGLGIVLIVGLLLVLATWWVHHVRAQRRRRRLGAAGLPRPATDQAPAGTLPPP